MRCSASLVGDGGAADASPGVPGTLVQNYRSHSSLLHIPNKLFYNQTLVAAADQAQLLPPAWSELESTDTSLAGGQPSTQPREEDEAATASAADEIVEDMVRVQLTPAQPIVLLIGRACHGLSIACGALKCCPGLKASHL